MPLLRPESKTIISTVDFGIPVYDFVVANTVTPWVPVTTFLSGWQNEGGSVQPMQYRKIGDVVYVRGMIRNGTAANVFQMPVGYRTATMLRFGIFTMDTQGVVYTGRMDIQPGGVLAVLNTVFTHTHFMNIAYSTL